MTTHIPKDTLHDGAYYAGRSRNTLVARWCGHTQRFYYWRTKFGQRYVDSLPAPEDEQKFDVFYAECEIDQVKADVSDVPFPVQRNKEKKS